MAHQHNAIKEKFKQHIQQLGYSKSSVQMLPNCVAAFLEYNNLTEPKEANQEHIKAFYEYLQNRKHQRKATTLSESFIQHHIYALNVFFNWLEATRQIMYNPISNLKFKRPKPNTREPLSKSDLQELFEATKTSKEIAILHLFYSCGLRRTEAENLNTNDIHFTQNLIYVREGKGAKRRVIPITEKVKQELLLYFNSNRKVPLSFGEGRRGEVDLEAFMLNANLTRMKGDQYNRILKQIVQRASLSFGEGREGEAKEISLHHLRHSIATHLLENGLSIEFVRDFLGHSQLETTQIYAKVKASKILKL
jgi:integrase/recombinase XerD